MDCTRITGIAGAKTTTRLGGAVAGLHRQPGMGLRRGRQPSERLGQSAIGEVANNFNEGEDDPCSGTHGRIVQKSSKDVRTSRRRLFRLRLNWGISFMFSMVGAVGLEPTTRCLRVSGLTFFATPAILHKTAYYHLKTAIY